MLSHIHRQSLRANKRANLVYLNNPKVGCSTVKDNLWRHLSPETYSRNVDVHSLENAPFSNLLQEQNWLRDANIFTFVRNPYTRLTSAYLNKIRGREGAGWKELARRHGLTDSEELSFDAFVELIAGDHVEWLDPHWRPQHLNIMYPFVRPDFLGHLETMDRDLPRVISAFLDIEVGHTPRKNAHGTGAGRIGTSLLGDDGTRRRILTLYEKDFEYFGYSENPETPEPGAAEPGFESRQHDGLALLQQMQAAPDMGAKAAIMRQLAELCAPIDDRYTHDWLLNTRLETAQARDEALALIRSSMERIETGYDFLQRTAARLALAGGDWQVVHHVSSTALGNQEA